MIVTRNKTTQITKNFDESEIFSKDPRFKGNSHYIDDKLIDVLQLIIDYYTQKEYDAHIIVTSTYRTLLSDQQLAPDVKYHPHSEGIAIDWKFTSEELNNILQKDLSDKGYVWNLIRKAGINGIGNEGFCFHFDTRMTHTFHDDEFGKYATWVKF